MRKLLLLSFTLVLTLMQQAFAQSRTVSGTVTDQSTGQGLPGVSIQVKGTSVGTATNADGAYTINVPTNGTTLVFRFIGYKTVERDISGASNINVSLSLDNAQLSEVVVTGYGERKQESFTGSAVTLGGAKFENKPFATVDQALQGNVPGLQLSSSSGTPGAVQNIRIRGISSITADNEPLYVIDGIPVMNQNVNDEDTGTGSLSPLSSINSNDIENVTVLKDASATALYGARGANGVIVITTKRGKAGKPVVSFSAQTGVVSRAVDGADMLSAAQLDELYYEARVNAGQATSIEDARARYNSGWDGVTDTDWKDVVTNDDAITRTYDLSVRGGNEKSRYYVSAGHFQQDGVTVGSNYKRTTGKINFENELSDKFTLSTSTNGSYVLQNGQLEGAAYYGNPESAYLFTSPFYSPYNADGSLNLDLGGSQYNPLYIAENDINRRKQSRILNSTAVEYRILNNLKFTSSIGLDYIINEELLYDNRHHGDGVNSATDLSQNGNSYVYNNRNFTYDWKNMLDYSWVINNNNKLDFKLVYEAQKNSYYTVATGGYGIAADGLVYPSSVGTVDYGTAAATDWAINSAMALVTYTLRNNIFIDGTYRREGHSRFAPYNKWGTFYSIAGSWLLSDEAFMQGTSEWLSNAKLKASYGKTGNAGIEENLYQSFLSYSGSYNSSPAVSPGQFGNKYLTWENNYSYNVGLDFGLFNRITGSVEYFNRKSTDLLQDVPLSYTTGFSSQYQNVGDMVNKGWEVSANADIIRSTDFKWNLGVNFTSVHNEVTRLAENLDGGEITITENSVRRVAEGQPVFSWYMPTWAGVDVQTGAPLWYVEGTSGETTSTYSKAGYSYHGSAMPTFFGGLNTRFDYKGIYLSASLYYSTGNKVYDSYAHYTLSDGRYNFTTSNGYATLYDRWQQPGDVAENPKNVYGNTSNSAAASTRRLYDAEYLRLRDVTLGYNLPAALISKLGLSNVNLYVKGNNLWTWVKDDKLTFDPEVKPNGLLQINAAPLKTIAVGINASF
ncbi:SusC/RagA family TonB-linked outer membrane protein [Pontibacter silvestris]|uniref:SusC/RagA family TonB-linked outer membrane protein n=1 Tax=Pontibacter silvestris TaxID=2305183 RepID=A0ABW4X0T5_9BACT|nr:TonB-dependent receptor [Pontibacter silvestris]MCC9135662.1 TonB-dependent receptor [Pontibacter silvestris]